MKKFAYVLQGLLALDFLFAGCSKVFFSAEQIREMFTDPLGTPVAMIQTVGVFEALAALLMIVGFRNGKAFLASIALIGAIMVGATVTNLAADLASDAMFPFVTLILAAVLAYLKRDALAAFRIKNGTKLSVSK